MTIWIRQGHYAQGAHAGNLPTPDYTVDDLDGVRAATERLLAGQEANGIRPL
ncbi:MAG: hypothetical protein ACR2PL_12315 [Dehalococcoidia bacterium]